MTGGARDGLRLRPMRTDDVDDVRRLFRTTIALGRPVPFPFTDVGRYEALALAWYLRPGRHGDHAVLTDAADRVVGYALVCVAQGAYERWARRAAGRWAAVTVGRLARRRYGAAEARFHRLRLYDGWVSWRRGPTAPLPAHAHVNLDPRARGRLHVTRLVDHIDARCAAAGLPGWFGEINARAGRRAAALESHGAHVVHRQPNHTLSWLAGASIERLTVTRRLADAVGR